MSVKNQVVIVTGAAGNLGRALVGALKDSGARLALFDHRKGRLGEMYPWTGTTDDYLIVEPIDLTDEESVQTGIEQVQSHFGRIDVLINAAGGYSGGNAVEETSTDTWQKMMDLNGRSVFLTSRSVVPIMRDQGAGAIVNIGARPGMEGVKNASAYSASKSAVLRLTESISAEVKADGIRVNAVIPGTIDTPDNREAMPNANHDRWVKPSAVTDVIIFLVSDAAQGIYGACIPVYGKS